MDALYADVASEVIEPVVDEELQIRPLSEKPQQLMKTPGASSSSSTSAADGAAGGSEVSDAAEASVQPKPKVLYSIYVGNLTWWTTETDVSDLCAEFGRVYELHIYEDPLNGKSKGYCRVSFGGKDVADAAVMNIPGRLLHGEELVANHVQKSLSPPSRNNRRGGSSSSAPSSSSTSSSSSSYASRYKQREWRGQDNRGYRRNRQHNNDGDRKRRRK